MKENKKRIVFCDTKTGKEYTDLMEMHILELSKLPPEEKNETSLLQWMRFLGGENRINQLNIELSKRGRTEDILKAAVDNEYQKKLLKEFEL